MRGVVSRPVRGARSRCRALALAGCLAAGLSRGGADASVLRVDPSGAGDFTTIQAAIDSIPFGNPEWVVIEIAPGTYFEGVRVPRGATRVSLLGAGRDRTIVQWDRSVLDALGRLVAEPVVTVDADEFAIRGVALHNLAKEPGGSGGKWDAAILTRGDRIVIDDVHLRGDHDTLLAYGPYRRVYVKDSWIQGRGDFIASFTTTYIRNSVLEAIRDKGHFLFQRGSHAGPIETRDRLVVADSVLRGMSVDPVWPTGVTNLHENAVVYLIRNTIEDGIGANRPPIHFKADDFTQYGAIRFREESSAARLDWTLFSIPGPIGTPRISLPVRENAYGEPVIAELSEVEAAAVTPAAILGAWDGWDPDGPRAPDAVWGGGTGAWHATSAWSAAQAPDPIRNVRIGAGSVTVTTPGAEAIDLELGGSGSASLAVHDADLHLRDVSMGLASTLSLAAGGQLRLRFLRATSGARVAIGDGSLEASDRVVIAQGASLEVGTAGELEIGHLTIKGVGVQTGGEVGVGLLLDVHEGRYDLTGGELESRVRSVVGSSPARAATLLVHGGALRLAGQTLVGAAGAGRGTLDVRGGVVDIAGLLQAGGPGGSGEVRISGGDVTLPTCENGISGPSLFEVVGGGPPIRLEGSYSQGALGALSVRVDASGLRPIQVTDGVSFATGATLSVVVDPLARPGTYTIMRWTGSRQGGPSVSIPPDARYDVIFHGNELRLVVIGPQVPALAAPAWALCAAAIGLAARRAAKARRCHGAACR
jgi:hypothetical protein